MFDPRGLPLRGRHNFVSFYSGGAEPEIGRPQAGFSGHKARQGKKKGSWRPAADEARRQQGSARPLGGRAGRLEQKKEGFSTISFAIFARSCSRHSLLTDSSSGKRNYSVGLRNNKPRRKLMQVGSNAHVQTGMRLMYMYMYRYIYIYI